MVGGGAAGPSVRARTGQGLMQRADGFQMAIGGTTASAENFDAMIVIEPDHRGGPVLESILISLL